MIGKTFKSEKRTFADKDTGILITQLTNTANNFHFYFTDNSFMKGDCEILFLSDRGAKREHIYNFFKMDLSTGEMTCLSDEGDISPNTYTKTPEGDIVVYVSGCEIKRLDISNGRSEVIYRCEDPVEIKSVSISCDKRYIIFLENEHVGIQSGQPNYSGFMEKMFAVKKCRIKLLDLTNGAAQKVFEDTHYSGHIQFSPTTPYIATYCHEGPWNLVQQRIWILNLMTRGVDPCVRQDKDDCIGHEFWTRDGLIFFENRREGHDGTITEHKTQAYAKAPESGLTPYVGFADSYGNVLRTIDMPVYCNHYHANNDNTLLVGDMASDIALIDISGEKAQPRTLCGHGTSWRTQTSHCHPTFSWNGDKVLFASDVERKLNIYMVDFH